MDVDRCVVCGNVIPEGRQVCPICMAGCEGCGWEDKDNCRACNKLDKQIGKDGRCINYTEHLYEKRGGKR